MPVPRRLSSLAGGEHLRRQGEQVHREIDAGEHAGLRVARRAPRPRRYWPARDKDGRAEREQADPRADAKEIGRADQLRERREGVAADTPRLGTRPGLRRGRALEPIDAEHRQLEEHRRGDEEIDRPERHRQRDGDDRAKQRAGGAAGADEAEQPLALFGAEEVGHERPEHRDREQIEDADPDEEDARHDRPARRRASAGARTERGWRRRSDRRWG